MERTQAAVVLGVGECLARRGVRRTTMIDIAVAAGIAKGTLYNHVRTKSEAVALYADDQVAELARLLAGDARGALGLAGDRVAEHAAVRRLVAEEPASVATALIGAGERLEPVREALEDLVGADRAPLALRWLLSLVFDPGTSAERVTTVGFLVPA